MSTLSRQPLRLDDEFAIEIVEALTVEYEGAQARQIAAPRTRARGARQSAMDSHGLGGIFHTADGSKHAVNR